MPFDFIYKILLIYFSTTERCDLATYQAISLAKSKTTTHNFRSTPVPIIFDPYALNKVISYIS